MPENISPTKPSPSAPQIPYSGFGVAAATKPPDLGENRIQPGGKPPPTTLGDLPANPPASQTTMDNVRADLPPVDTSIDPSQFSAAPATTLEPPTDIDPANIGDYTDYEASTGEVTPEATVESRMNGLLSRNSDYMKRAEARANQMSNRRGLLNSSMAVGAARGAAIDAALPIATQDAQSNLTMDLANQGYENQAAQYTAQSSKEKANLQAGLDQDTSVFNATQDFEAQKINTAEQNRLNFAQFSADLQGQLAGINNELAANLVELESTFDIIQNLDSVNGAIYQQLTAAIADILSNTQDPGEANAKINALIESVGAELEFSDGTTIGTNEVDTPPPPPGPGPGPISGGNGGDGPGMDGGGPPASGGPPRTGEGGGGPADQGNGGGGLGPGESPSDAPGTPF